MVQKVCELIAEGKNPAEIERIDGMPSARTIANWTWQHPEFYVEFDKAREFGTHAMAYKCAQDIEACGRDPNELSKLKIKMDFYKWFIGKLNQKKYGERTTVMGDKDNPLTIGLAQTLDERIAARTAKKAIEQSVIMPIIDAESVEIES